MQVLLFSHQETKRHRQSLAEDTAYAGQTGIQSGMEPPRRSAAGAASEAYSAAGSDAEDDRYCSANSALGTPSSIGTLRPSADFWDHQMDLQLDDHPAVTGFPKKRQLSLLQAPAPAQSRPGAGPPPAAAGGEAIAQQGSSPGSPRVHPRPDHNQVGSLDFSLTD